MDFKGTTPDLGWKEYVPVAGVSDIKTSNIKIEHTGNNICINSEKPFPQATVYDINGKRIATHTGYVNKVNFEVPQNELYLVRVVIDGKSYGYKIK